MSYKTIQSPIGHHNKIDNLRASFYCLRDLRLNCGLVLKLEDVYRQKIACITFLVVTTKTWTLVIGLDPIFSFRANKCHFFSVTQYSSLS